MQEGRKLMMAWSPIIRKTVLYAELDEVVLICGCTVLHPKGVH